MQELSLSLFDIIFLSAVLIFGSIAFLKGFIKEIFSIFNWIMAIMMAYVTAPFVTKLFADTVYPAMIIDSIVQIVLFVLFVIFISIFTSKLSRPLSERVPVSVNQPLGLIFGCMKAYLIVALVFTIITTIYSHDVFLKESEIEKQKLAREMGDYKVGPDWLKESISYDFLASGSAFLQPFVNFAIYTAKNSALKGKGSMNAQMMQKIDKINQLDNSDNLEPRKKKDELKEVKEYYEEEGYDIDEIYQMKNLIDTLNINE